MRVHALVRIRQEERIADKIASVTKLNDYSYIPIFTSIRRLCCYIVLIVCVFICAFVCQQNDYQKV
jgi:hypothetical protein